MLKHLLGMGETFGFLPSGPRKEGRGYVQWVQYLQCKREDLGVIPSALTQELSRANTPVTPVPRRWGRQIRGTHWLTSLAGSVSPGSC